MIQPSLNNSRDFVHDHVDSEVADCSPTIGPWPRLGSGYLRTAGPRSDKI